MSYLNRTALALGRSTETAPLVEEAYQIARTAEDWFCVALALEHQALLCQRQERMDEAQQMLAEAHALDRQIGDDWSRSRVLIRLGQLALDNGDLAAAHQHFVDALQLAHHTALLAHALEALTGLASLLAVQGASPTSVDAGPGSDGAPCEQPCDSPACSPASGGVAVSSYAC